MAKDDPRGYLPSAAAIESRLAQERKDLAKWQVLLEAAKRLDEIESQHDFAESRETAVAHG